MLTASGQTSHLVTIRDADTATIAFQQAATTVGEDDPATLLTLVLTTAPGNTLENGATITINATNGSAENADYDSATFPKTVTFTAGQGNGATQTVSFDPASDTLIEGDETVTLAIANGPLLTGSGQTNHVVTIHDADNATVSFQSPLPRPVEDDSAAAWCWCSPPRLATRWKTAPRSRSTPPTARPRTRTTTSGAFPKTVTFTAGQGNGATQTVSFDPASDTLVEGDETVTLAIANGSLLTGSGQTNESGHDPGRRHRHDLLPVGHDHGRRRRSGHGGGAGPLHRPRQYAGKQRHDHDNAANGSAAIRTTTRPLSPRR